MVLKLKGLEITAANGATYGIYSCFSKVFDILAAESASQWN
jgi:hypothetical protein